MHDDSEAFATHHLPVGDGHVIRVAEHGRPEGPPVLTLHGGPGSGTRLEHRFVDAAQHRIVRFDQRGAGASTPSGGCEANTTWHLVEDIERIRKHLGIGAWGVLGLSWGSTLALAYAQAHPAAVQWLVLQGVWLFRRADIDFQFAGGAMRWFAPEGWLRFVEHLPPHERDEPVAAYHRRIHGPDEAAARAAAVHWNEFEAHYSSLVPDAAFDGRDDPLGRRFARAKILTHYAVHGGWFAGETHLLDRVDRIRHVPASLIHSRYDLVCPFEGAWRLHRAWPEAAWHVLHDGGHSAADEPVGRVVMAEVRRLAAAV
jgi:proline iminopeptidase